MQQRATTKNEKRRGVDLADPSNAALEWQARIFKRKPGIGGGMPTRRACSMGLL